MDVPRKDIGRRRTRRRILLLLAIFSLGAVCVAAVSNLSPAVPSIPASEALIDTVQRGAMLRRVQATGRLVPVKVTWITAATDGRVVELPLKAGTEVETDSIIVKLANSELESNAQDAKWAYNAAKADYKATERKLQNELLQLTANVDDIRAKTIEAKLQLDVDKQLFEEGLLSGQKHQLSSGRYQALRKSEKISQKQEANFEASIEPQLLAEQAKVEQASALHDLRRRQIDNLTMKSGIRGILQQLGVTDPKSTFSSQTLAVGQWVTSGQPLAMISDPFELQAELRVPEVQAQDIILGQHVDINARVAILAGTVSRIDPAASQGTVTIDVKLGGDLPHGVRPDLNVVGDILIEKLENVLHVGRIALAQPNTRTHVFRLDDEGYAEKVQIKVGRCSTNLMEIESGLSGGDRVIVSDMRSWDSLERIKVQ